MQLLKSADDFCHDLIYRRELYSAINSATTMLTGAVIVLIYFFYFY
jgi:hypothetical protein